MANPNPIPFKKTGADANPNGRPKRDWTWSGLLEKVADEIEPKTGKPFKELVTRRMWIDAVNGNLGAQKEILNRMEGLPVTRQLIAGIEGGAPIPLITVTNYGNTDPLQLQARTTKPSGDPRFITSSTVSGTQLAQEGKEDNTSNKPVDKMGGTV